MIGPGHCGGVLPLLLCAAVPLAGGSAYGAPAAAPAGLARADMVAPGLSELSSDVVYAASKRLQYTQQAPAIVHVFTRETIVRGGYRNLGELLATIPEIELVDTGRRQLLLFKGVPFTVLALLDGVSLVNHGDNRVDLEQRVPLEIVRKVEVVLAPGGVLWGAHSVYGVVNIITRELGERSQQRVRVQGGSWSTLRSAYTLFARHGDLRWQLHLNAESSRSKSLVVQDSFYDPWWTAGNGGPTYGAAGLSVQAFAALSWRGFSLRALTRLVDEHPYAIHEHSGARITAPYSNRHERPGSLVSAAYRHRLSGEWLALELTSRAYLFHQSYRDENYSFPPTARVPLGWHYLTEVERDLRVGVSQEAQAAYWRQMRTVLGVEGIYASTTGLHLHANYNGRETDEQPYGPHSSYTLSLYGQQEWQPLAPLNLAVGVRGNLATSYAAAMVLHGHLVFEPLDGLFAKLNYSEGLRPPGFDQRYMDNHMYRGSTVLDPERSRVAEAQASYLLPLGQRARLELQCGYTFSQLLGLIGSRSETSPKVYENLDDETLHTLSASLRLRFDPWLTLGAHLAHHLPRGRDGEAPRADFARQRLSARATVVPFSDLSLSLHYGLTGARRVDEYEVPATLELTTLDLPAYHELSLTLRYRLFQTGFVLTASAHNLLVQDYDHCAPYTHLTALYRGPFPQPAGPHGFLSLEWEYAL